MSGSAVMWPHRSDWLRGTISFIITLGLPVLIVGNVYT